MAGVSIALLHYSERSLNLRFTGHQSHSYQFPRRIRVLLLPINSPDDRSAEWNGGTCNKGIMRLYKESTEGITSE